MFDLDETKAICAGCVARGGEVSFLREMVKSLTEKQNQLMTDTLVPRSQPTSYFSPTLVSEDGKIVKLDAPEKPAGMSDEDIVNEIIGH